MSGGRPRLFLIDGSAQIFRAYHAIRHLASSRGLPTNAVYGYTQMLLKIVRDHRPDYLAVVFDRPEPTFRHAMFPAYKANRPAPPEDLIPQFDWIKRVTAAFRVPVIERPGLEADDIIGTLARKAEAAGMDAVIVTGDKDFCQIVTEHVTLLDTMREKVTGPAEVRERFGVEPARVVEVMGLMGDPVDNIPGVPGVGEKTAAKLIGEYGTLEAVLARAGEIPGKLGERLREHGAGARLSRELVTIRTDADVPFEPDRLRVQEPDREALSALFAELEFRSLLSEFAPPARVAECRYETVTEEEALAALVARLRVAGRFAVDTETTALDPMRAHLVGISFSCAEGVGYYLPLGHTGEGAARQIPLDRALALVGPLLADPAVKKIGQNVKYDQVVLARAGVHLAGVEDDTMLASYVLDPARPSHGMDALAREFLGRKTLTYTEVTGRGRDQVSFAEVPVDLATRYAAEDAEVTWCLAQRLLPDVEAAGLLPLYREIEVPLVEVLAAMEMAGVALDLTVFRKLAERTDEELSALGARIQELAGVEFNINSTKQLAEVLFERLRIPPVKKTKTGYSTDVEVLEKLAPRYEICRLLVDYRQAQKLKGTYIDALPRLVHPETGRVHTSFNQTVAATGRLSSSDPNLQNIPIRTEEGRKIRAGFVAPPGAVLIGADYSQIELRILAHVSGDPNLVDSFRRGEDIHERTARQMYGLLPGTVTPELRRQAKTINFGIIYGMSGFGLARQLDIGNREASELIDAYFRQYPGVRRFIDETIERARREKEVRTLFGRRRGIADLDAADRNIRSFAERVAINTPIQGTAADLIKRAMIAVHRRLARERLSARMILQVHDELLLEAPVEEAELVTRIVREEMEGAARLDVPLVVDVARGTNWAEIH